MEYGINERLLNIGCGSIYHKDWVNLDFISTASCVQKCNLLRGIPYQNESFDAVYSSHFLEHFTYDRAQFILSEKYRVLKKNGIVRIVVPDLEYIVRGYIEYLELCRSGDSSAYEKYDWLIIELFDQISRNSSGGNMGRVMNSASGELEKFIIDRVGNFKETDEFRNRKIPKYRAYINKALDRLIPQAYKIGKFRKGGEVHYHMYDEFSLKRLLLDMNFKSVSKLDSRTSSIPNWNLFDLDYKNKGGINLIMEARK